MIKPWKQVALWSYGSSSLKMRHLLALCTLTFLVWERVVMVQWWETGRPLYCLLMFLEEAGTVHFTQGLHIWKWWLLGCNNSQGTIPSCKSLFPIWGSPENKTKQKNQTRPMNSSHFFPCILSITFLENHDSPFPSSQLPSKPEELLHRPRRTRWRVCHRSRLARRCQDGAGEFHCPVSSTESPPSCEGRNLCTRSWVTPGCRMPSSGKQWGGENRRKLLIQKILSSNEIPGWIYRDIRAAVSGGEKRIR